MMSTVTAAAPTPVNELSRLLQQLISTQQQLTSNLSQSANSISHQSQTQTITQQLQTILFEEERQTLCETIQTLLIENLTLRKQLQSTQSQLVQLQQENKKPSIDKSAALHTSHVKSSDSTTFASPAVSPISAAVVASSSSEEEQDEEAESESSEAETEDNNNAAQTKQHKDTKSESSQSSLGVMSIHAESSTEMNAIAAISTNDASKSKQQKHQQIPIILGTSSKYRQKLMQQLNYKYTIRTADIDERAILVDPEHDSISDRSHSDPAKLTLAIAKAKATAILNQLLQESSNIESLLITADQVAYFNGEIREKPLSEDECRHWFVQYAQKPVEAMTAIVVTNTKTLKQYTDTVYIRQLYKSEAASDPKVIESLLAEGELMQCCGAFIVDSPLVQPYLSDEQSIGQQSDKMGFPLETVKRLIQQATKDALNSAE